MYLKGVSDVSANRKKIKVSPMQMIAISFAVIILLGAILLTLPIAAQDGQSVGFRGALFTATSATCVTGLVLFETGTQWSGFGQAVIITLIEIGGLGFMSMASLVIFALRKKVGLKQRMLMAQALSVNEMASVVKLQKWVLLGSLTIQLAGALVLFLRFLPEYGVALAAKWGVFHAISAFCNAGFDVFGNGDSIAAFQSDPVVLITLMALITVGGLGFFVWHEVATTRNFKKLSVYTKLVLIMTCMLIIAGAGLFLLLEWNNPMTIGNMSLGDKLLNSFFQSVTLRTAGFASFNQADITDAGKGISLVLMLIGGSSGSTAGGAKTVTFVVVILFLIARCRGRKSVNVFHRNISEDKFMDAMTIVSVMVGLALAGAMFISATSPVNFTNALFESVSALATVGLTAGVTPLLSIPAQFMIILFMYFGRVGILTISLGFLMGNKAEDRFRYANTNLLIG